MSAAVPSTSFAGFITSFIRKNRLEEAVPPTLRGARKFPYGAFFFEFLASKGCPYEIQASANLKLWETVAKGVSSSECTEFIDSEAPRFKYRFYRVNSGVLSSTNVVGFATVYAPPGFSLIANPFESSAEFIGLILPNMPEGTALHKFSSTQHKMVETKFSKGRWSNPMEKFVAGEGGLFFNPTSETFSLQFCGEVAQGHLLNPVPAGFSIRSSLVPMAGQINTDLEFPLTEGDSIQIFDREKQEYITYDYPSKKWEIDPPIVGVGEAFWVEKSSPANWVRNFRLG
ncbi:MAG: hypothetical protein ACK4UN_01020 [Limisphaerales bacterium]